MQVIPSIDIFEGRCVRLVKGQFGDRTDYAVDPRTMAELFFQAGARSLHVVDLEGASKGRVTNWDTIERILSLKGHEIQVGGGIRSELEIEKLLALGAARIVIGSVAVQSPQNVTTWVGRFEPKDFCIALDIRNGELMYDGWQKSAATSFSDTMELMLKCGITRFLSTDISKDGMLSGPNLELYSTLVRKYPGVQWFASGGVRSVEDVIALKSAGLAGAIVGKALFEGTIRLEELLEAAC